MLWTIEGLEYSRCKRSPGLTIEVANSENAGWFQERRQRVDDTVVVCIV